MQDERNRVRSNYRGINESVLFSVGFIFVFRSPLFPIERNAGTERATVRINLRSSESSFIFFLRDNKMLWDRLEKVFSLYLLRRLLTYLLASFLVGVCSRYHPDLCAYYCYVASYHPRMKFVSGIFSARLEDFDCIYMVANERDFNQRDLLLLQCNVISFYEWNELQFRLRKGQVWWMDEEVSRCHWWIRLDRVKILEGRLKRLDVNSLFRIFIIMKVRLERPDEDDGCGYVEPR